MVLFYILFKQKYNYYYSKLLQSNPYKMTTLGTTQKSLSWAGGHLIKHLHKLFIISKQIWSSLAGF